MDILSKIYISFSSLQVLSVTIFIQSLVVLKRDPKETSSYLILPRLFRINSDKLCSKLS